MPRAPRRAGALAVLAAVAPLIGLAALTGLAGCDNDRKAPLSPAPAPAPASSAPKKAAPDPTDRPSTRPSDAIGIPEPLPRTPGTIRVATYNLENLFDDKDDPNYSGKYEDLASTKPVEQLKGLAAAIHKVDADVLAVEEVESQDALRAFRDDYLADMGYTYLVSLDSGDLRGIEQAVLSRFPLEKAQVWPNLPLAGVHPDKFGNEPNEFAGEPITYRRSPLRVDVVVPAGDAPAPAAAYRLTLFVVHHKAGRAGGYWREAEASKAVELIAQAEAATPGDDNVIVLGDFNATAGEASVKTYLDNGFVTAERLAKASDDVKARHWKSAAWTTHASGRTIDMILLNPNAAKAFVPASMFVLGTPQRPRGADWRTTPPPPGYGSDHEPVAIDLTPRD
jgi:hypothetical protein